MYVKKVICCEEEGIEVRTKLKTGRKQYIIYRKWKNVL